jgi:putative heme-binding domain-containing protein
VRFVAQRRLADRGAAGEKRLVALLKNKKAPAYARWSAIWTLDAIDGGTMNRSAIIAALSDKDVTVQAQAARQLGTRQVREAVAPLVAMLQSTNAMLRFRAATALGRIGDPAAVIPLERALADRSDLFARYAAFKALNRIGQSDSDAWTQIVVGLAAVDPSIREGVYFATRETYDVGLIKALTEFMTVPGIPTEIRITALNLLSSLYMKTQPWNGDWWNTVPVNGPRPVKNLSWEGTPLVADAMRNSLLDTELQVRQIAFDWVQNSHDAHAGSMLRAMYAHETNIDMRAMIVGSLPAVDDADTRAVIGPILEDSNAPEPLLDAALKEAVKIGGDEWNEDMVRISDRPMNDNTRVELFRYYGEHKLAATAPLLGRYLDSSDYTLRGTAFEGLDDIGGEAAIAQLLPKLKDAATGVRRQAINGLAKLKAKQAIPELMRLATNGDLAVEATEALTRMPDLAALDVYLNGLASKNAALRSQCRSAVVGLREAALPVIEKKLAVTNALPDDAIASLKQIYQNNPKARKGILFKLKVKQMPISQYQSFAMANSGDANRGREIFFDANGVNCMRCHSIEGRGGHIGPDLNGIGTKQDRAQIIESVLYPSKVILDGYQQVYFHTKDDEDYAGIIRGENSETVTIIDSLGVTTILAKSNIESRKISQVSLMPDGLQAGLTLQEFADLIAFVQSANGPARGTAPMRMASQSAFPYQNRLPRRAGQPPDPAEILRLPPLPVGPAGDTIKSPLLPGGEPEGDAIQSPPPAPAPAPSEPISPPRDAKPDAGADQPTNPPPLPPMPPGFPMPRASHQ